MKYTQEQLQHKARFILVLKTYSPADPNLNRLLGILSARFDIGTAKVLNLIGKLAQ